MKTIFSTALTAAAALALTSSLAQADGFYVSGKIGSSTADHEIARATATPGLPVAEERVE